MPSSTTPLSPAGRRFALTRGAVAMTAGAVVALGGGGILAIFGTDGTLATGHHDLSSPANAIVTPVAGIRHTGDAASLIGRARLEVSARPTTPAGAFVGVARARDVDAYLRGASAASVSDLGAGSITVGPASGTGRPRLPAPTTRSFWVARSSAAGTPTLRWTVRDGRYRLVVMSADGRRGVATSTAVGVGAPKLPWIGLALLLLGLFVIGASVFRVERATRRPVAAFAGAV